jgi:hypothetical protein
MKAVIKIVILLHILLSPAFSADDELSLLSSKIELYLQEKGWQLESTLELNNVAYYKWRNKNQLVKVSFFYCNTKQDAADQLQQDIKGITAELGSGKKILEIGDEAYEWDAVKGNQALVNFRKNRVIVAVCASSISEAKNFAKIITDLLGSEFIARAAA